MAVRNDIQAAVTSALGEHLPANVAVSLDTFRLINSITNYICGSNRFKNPDMEWKNADLAEYIEWLEAENTRLKTTNITLEKFQKDTLLKIEQLTAQVRDSQHTLSKEQADKLAQTKELDRRTATLTQQLEELRAENAKLKEVKEVAKDHPQPSGHTTEYQEKVRLATEEARHKYAKK